MSKFKIDDIVAVRFSAADAAIGTPCRAYLTALIMPFETWVCIIVEDDGIRYVVDYFGAPYLWNPGRPKYRHAYGINYIDRQGEIANNEQMKSFKKLMLEHQMSEFIEK